MIASAKEIDALNITLFNSCINSTNVHLCNYCTKIFVIVVNTCVCRPSVDNKAVIPSYPWGPKGRKKFFGDRASLADPGTVPNREQFVYLSVYILYMLLLLTGWFIFFGDRAFPVSKGLNDHPLSPPPLSQGLDPALLLDVNYFSCVLNFLQGYILNFARLNFARI